MNPLGYMSELVTPDKSRWKPMLMALGVAMAGIQLVAFLKPPEAVTGIVVLLVMLAWAVGACAMIGYLRWFFASEVARIKREKGEKK
ncbi:MAG TPA: hypothetical protein VK043_15400 [Burkholderiales bacterium]|nr:hypothetical protein [Burkholderiales bacterium]